MRPTLNPGRPASTSPRQWSGASGADPDDCGIRHDWSGKDAVAHLLCFRAAVKQQSAGEPVRVLCPEQAQSRRIRVSGGSGFDLDGQ